MNPELAEPKNPHIETVYGPMLESCFSQVRLKGLTIDKFEPATGTIVVKKVPPETLTEGGIHLPPSAQRAQNIGAVVAVNGDECPYAVGDLVCFRSGGYPLQLREGDEYLILQYRGAIDDEVLGKFLGETVDAP
jgi:co-chaperonin GroES (HSP10)